MAIYEFPYSSRISKLVSFRLSLEAASCLNCLGRSTRPPTYKTGTSCQRKNGVWSEKCAFRHHESREGTLDKSQLKTYHSPDVKYDIGRLGQRIPTGSWGVFHLVPSADLIEGYDNDDNPKEYMEVVLQWTASESGFGLDLVDDIADKNLDDV